MALQYFFGIQNRLAVALAPYFKKYKVGTYNTNAIKPPIDTAFDNDYQFWGDHPTLATAVRGFKAVDINGQFNANNPNGVVAWAFATAQIATPSAPTITNAGTVGSTTYTYTVVAKNGQGATLGFTPASSGGSTTTGNATLSGTNYNVVTIVPVPGAVAYDVYRTVGGATQGKIGTVAQYHDSQGLQVGATNSQGTTFLNDTGLTGDSTTAPTVNTTGMKQGPVNGDITILALATPANVVVTPQGTTGATSYSYKVVARSQNGTTAASTAGSTTTGNATLTAANNNLVTWNPVGGALSYDVYRTVGGATQGKIGNVLSTAALSLADTGLTGDASTAPTVNTTGSLSAATVANYIAVETGANNAVVGSLPGVTIGAGTDFYMQLAHSLQAGANTAAINGGSAIAIKSSRNPANNIATAYASSGVIHLLYNGTAYLDLSQ